MSGNTSIWQTSNAQRLATETNSKPIRQGIPEELKDAKYWEKRKKNNIAAKKSRDRSRQGETYIKRRCIELESENALLRRELKNIKSKFGLSVEKVFLTDSDREECSKEVAQVTTQIMKKYMSSRDSSAINNEARDPKVVSTEKAKSAKLENMAQNFKPVYKYTLETSPDRSNENNETNIEDDLSHHRGIWNHFSEASPTTHYILSRPEEEDAVEADIGPADLTINKRRKIADCEQVSERGSCNFQVLQIDKNRLQSTNSAKDASISRKSENIREEVDEGMTVLDLTKDEDEVTNDDLNIKLKNLSDQIEAMQKLVNQKVVFQYD